MVSDTLQQALHTPEKVHVGKLLRLVDIDSLDNFLVVKEYPRVVRVTRDLLSNERDIVASTVSTHFLIRVQSTYPA